MNIWFILTSTGIGGAEKRALKISEGIKKTNQFNNVNFVLPESLYRKYLEDKELSLIVKNSQIAFKIYDEHHPDYVQKAKRYLKLLFKYKNYIPNVCYKYAAVYFSKEVLNYLNERINDKDVIHQFIGDPSLIATILLSKRRNIKSVIEVTGVSHSGEKPPFYFNLFSASNLTNIAITNVSEVTYNNFENHYKYFSLNEKWLNTNVYVYPIPFLKNEFPEVTETKENTVIYASRFYERKNPLLFAKVVKELYADNQLNNWKVYFRGNGPLENEIKTILKEEIDSGKIDVGFSKNIDEEFHQSKIFVSIIKTGNYPSQSAFEAYGNGNILVLSDTGNTREKYTNKYFKIIAPTISSVKQGLLQAKKLAESDQYYEVSKDIQSHYLQNFDSKIVINFLNDIYSQRNIQ